MLLLLFNARVMLSMLVVCVGVRVCVRVRYSAFSYNLASSLVIFQFIVLKDVGNHYARKRKEKFLFAFLFVSGYITLSFETGSSYLALHSFSSFG